MDNVSEIMLILMYNRNKLLDLVYETLKIIYLNFCHNFCVLSCKLIEV
jgi:hypothetical protein